MLKDYQQQFIALALQYNALKFGEFTLKSGRKSPYFFNMGAFYTGDALAQVGEIYAQAITHANLTFNGLFGPAYKGIPLASATAIALATHHQRDVTYSFNRKEAKTHGEGGMIVGAPLAGKIVIIDDVITQGTAISEIFPYIQSANATLAGIVVALDRQERIQGNLSAIQEIEQQHHVPVVSIITLSDLIAYLRTYHNDKNILVLMEAYQAEYGAMKIS